LILLNIENNLLGCNMKNLKQYVTKKSLVAFAIAMTAVGTIGVGLGAKYLNKSQEDFNHIKQELKITQDKLAITKSQLTKLKSEFESVVSLKDKQILEMKSWKDRKSFVMVNRNLLEENLKTYKKLTAKNRKIILDTVISEATKYNINPIILYSLLHVESSMRFWIQHTPIKITINKRPRTVMAVGLGGVVWEWWGKQLINAKIAEVRSDLFDPEINIKATAFILNEFSKRKMLKGTKSKDESMLRRYFGGNFKSYSDKIDKKMMMIIRPNIYRY